MSKQKFKTLNWKILELGLDRDNLKERILQEQKICFLELLETKNLISKYGYDLPILETIGYREAKSVLKNELNIHKAIELINSKTIQFYKTKNMVRNKNNPIWLNDKNLLKMQ